MADELGRDLLNSRCTRILYFLIRTASARSILFSRRGRRGTDWKGVATRLRAEERTDWAEVMRRPCRTAARRHTETHDRRAHHNESSVIGFFFTSMALVKLAGCVPFMGNNPRNCHGRGIMALLNVLSKSPARHGDR